MEPLDRFGAFVDRVPDPVGGRGPLAGLRLAVKDNIAVADSKWTAGLPLFADRVAGTDASCVAALRAAGAVVVGTVATDAAGFGMMTPGVLNPLAPERTAGGSSGGSAAAVAGCLADIALGTDTAGSVRVPAACCGLYGLKPTHGRIPLDGITPLSHSFDHVGILAREIEPLQRAMRVVLPQVGGEDHAIRRIGFEPSRLVDCDVGIRSAVDRALAWLAAEGHALVEIELPERAALAEMHGAIVCGEALDIWRAHWPQDAARFADTARRSLAYAASMPADEIVAARSALADARAMMTDAFSQADVIVGPTIAVPPPKVGARRVPFCGFEAPVVFALLAETCPFNVSGHPALSLPLPWPGAGGIPVSLQVAGQRDAECGLLELAIKLQALAEGD